MENNIRKIAALSAVLALFSCELEAAIDISVTPNTAWAVGSGAAGTWLSPSPYVIKNNGESARINVRATDSPNWRLAKSAGLNAFALEWGNDPVWKSIYTSDTMMFPSLAAGAEQSFNFRYHSPTSINPLISVPQPAKVRFTAVSPYIGNWVTSTANNLGLQSFAMAAGVGGTIHVVYGEDGNGDGNMNLKYFKWDGLGQPLIHGDIDPANVYNNSNFDIALALDSGDNPHIVYHEGYFGRLRYARYNGTAWIVKYVDTDVNSVRVSGGEANYSFALDSNNNPHIAFVTSELPNRVKYAVSANSGDNWVIKDVDEGGSCSIKLDSNGDPHIAYSVSISNPMVFSADGLKYAKWNSETNQWEISIVETGGRTGLDPQLELDRQNKPFIVFYSEGAANSDATVKLAKLGTDNHLGVQNIIVAAGSPSIAVNSSGYPIITFRSWIGSQGFGYYQWTGTEWLSSTLGEDVSTIPLVRLDPDGRAHVGYGDSNRNFKYLKWE